MSLARRLACVVTIAASLPYLVLKAIWLAGVPVGASTPAGAAELLDTRHLLGDLITAGMEVVAVVLALALCMRWGQRVPALLIAGPIWLGVGLLAPIALGVPVGLAVQAVTGGSPAPADNGLQGWVYACVDGGFVVQGLALLVGFVGYTNERWPGVLSPQRTSVARPTVVAAMAAGVYAVAMILWSAGGRAWGGPAGFDTVTQRTFLVATGILVLAGAIAAVAPTRNRVLIFLGAGVAVTSGPSGLALSNHGEISPPYAVVSLIAVLAGLVLAATCGPASIGRPGDGPTGSP
jgi:hypothetical protein